MNSPPAAVPTMPVTVRWTGKRVSLCLLAAPIAAGVVDRWQFERLSSMEPQLVGTWVGELVTQGMAGLLYFARGEMRYFLGRTSSSVRRTSHSSPRELDTSGVQKSDIGS